MNPVLPQHLRAGIIISISPQEPTEEPQSLEAFTMSAQQQQQQQQQHIMNIEISESQDGGQHNIILSSSSSSDYCGGPSCNNMPIPTTISTIRKESERPRSMLTALLNEHNDTEEESSTNLLIEKQQQQQQPLKLSPRKSNSCSSLMIGEEDDSHTIPLPTKSVSPPSDIPPSMLLPQKSILSLSDGENHYHPRR
jgi:hypothetical protein